MMQSYRTRQISFFENPLQQNGNRKDFSGLSRGVL